MSIKGNVMKKLIVKALIVLSVILISEVSVYAHEETLPELSPLDRARMWALGEAKVNCSTILMMAFPDSIEIAQFSNEIVIDATENFEKSIPSGATVEQLSTYAKTGIAMWDNSDEKGKTDMLKICGQEILKEKIPPPSLFPDPQTHLFM
jgi:hypothetical protein